MQFDWIKLLSIRWKTPDRLGFFFWQHQQPGCLICMADPLNHAKGVADMTRKEWFVWRKWLELERGGIKLRSPEVPCYALATSGIRQLPFLFLAGRIEGEDTTRTGWVKVFGANTYFWLNVESRVQHANWCCGNQPESLASFSPHAPSLRNFRGQREWILELCPWSNSPSGSMCCGDTAQHPSCVPAPRTKCFSNLSAFASQPIPPTSPSLLIELPSELACCFDNSWEERVGEGEVVDWKITHPSGFWDRTEAETQTGA